DGFDPLRRLLTPSEIGLAGHSRGADAASIIGARDRRIKAIVAFDNLMATTSPDDSGNVKPLHPRVPALGMSADYYEAPQPFTADPPPLDNLGSSDSYRTVAIYALEV